VERGVGTHHDLIFVVGRARVRVQDLVVTLVGWFTKQRAGYNKYRRRMPLRSTRSSDMTWGLGLLRASYDGRCEL